MMFFMYDVFFISTGVGEIKSTLKSTNFFYELFLFRHPLMEASKKSKICDFLPLYRLAYLRGNLNQRWDIIDCQFNYWQLIVIVIGIGSW